MSIWMTEELILNWGSKNLIVMTGTLWQSKVRGDILGHVPSQFLDCIVKWVFRSGLRILRMNNFQRLIC